MTYVGVNFGRRKAEEVIADIRIQADMLQTFPSVGRVFAKDTELGITYRSFTDKLNRIVYYVDGETINIVTVWQNRRDIKKLYAILSENKI